MQIPLAPPRLLGLLARRIATRLGLLAEVVQVAYVAADRLKICVLRTNTNRQHQTTAKIYKAFQIEQVLTAAYDPQNECKSGTQTPRL